MDYVYMSETLILPQEYAVTFNRGTFINFYDGSTLMEILNWHICHSPMYNVRTFQSNVIFDFLRIKYMYIVHTFCYEYTQIRKNYVRRN